MGKISAMTAASAVAAANEFEINEAGVTKKATALQIKDYVLPYKRYIALLNQSGAGAPVATVLENTLSSPIVWARSGAGEYTGTLANAFTASKTFIVLGSPAAYDSILGCTITSGDDEITVFSQSLVAGAFVLSDSILGDTAIEIRVYP